MTNLSRILFGRITRWIKSPCAKSMETVVVTALVWSRLEDLLTALADKFYFLYVEKRR